MITAAKLSLPFRYKATVNEDQKIFRPLKDMNPTLCNASLFITPSSFRNNFKTLVLSSVAGSCVNKHQDIFVFGKFLII